MALEAKTSTKVGDWIYIDALKALKGMEIEVCTKTKEDHVLVAQKVEA